MEHLISVQYTATIDLYLYIFGNLPVRTAEAIGLDRRGDTHVGLCFPIHARHQDCEHKRDWLTQVTNLRENHITMTIGRKP